MIEVSNSDILQQHKDVMTAYSSGACAPFLFSDYVKHSFPKLYARAEKDRLAQIRKRSGKNVDSIYPYQVKIPKSLNEMLEGDFEPKQIITVEAPIEGIYGPMWFGDATDGVFFRWGYVNGDSRQISSDGLNDNTVHGFLGGATGKGKSVTLNCVIYGCCLEYPPWELTLTLSDAKIVEFKSIAVGHPMPQIDIIAATADVDFMLSVLQQKVDEMNLRQRVFTKASEAFGIGIKNIKEFRKVTGLTLPRDVLICDEVTAMLTAAGKKASKECELIDSIGRLGRNAGVHILLTSQEVCSDLPDKTLANMSLRGAMGCTAPISEKIIGNPAAAENFNRKGRLIVNKDPSAKNNIQLNTLVRVPYLPENDIPQIAHSIIDAGNKFDVIPVLRFYDEDARLYEKQYTEFINQFPKDKNKIYLGPPSFIMDGDEQCVTLNFTCDDSENICAFVNSTNGKLRALKMLKLNLLPYERVSNAVMCADSMYLRKDVLKEFNPDFIFEEKEYETSQFIEIARSTIYRRLLCIAADKRVFKDAELSENSQKAFYSVFDKGGEFDTVTNQSRFYYYINLLHTDAALRKGFKLDKLSGEALSEKILQISKVCIRMCKQQGCFSTPVTAQALSNVYYWVLGMERIIGLGRDNRSVWVEDFKKLLQDGSPANVHFIIITSKMEDCSSLRESIFAFLLEDLNKQQQNQVKCADDYPEHLSAGLMLLYRPNITTDDRLLKFKKLMLEDEIL